MDKDLRIAELEAENQELCEALARQGVVNTWSRLRDICDEAAYDGNDDGWYDSAMDAAAADYIAAQDAALRVSDPDLYEERRQMGLL